MVDAEIQVQNQKISSGKTHLERFLERLHDVVVLWGQMVN